MIQSVERAISILEILEEYKESSVTEIAGFLSINKSTASRLLATLEAKNMVEKNKDSGKYMLGVSILRMSGAILTNINMSKVAEPYLHRLVKDTNESAHLCILSPDYKAVFIDQVKSPNGMNISGTIGSEEPIHCSAVGKCMAAFLPSETLIKVVDQLDFHKFTDKTITNKEKLLAQMREVRQKGYAVDDEEVYKGVRCVASPIRNHRGKVIAAIGLSGPANSVDEDKIHEYGQSVKRIAQELSLQMGYK